jgi:hypothetical protein
MTLALFGSYVLLFAFLDTPVHDLNETRIFLAICCSLDKKMNTSILWYVISCLVMDVLFWVPHQLSFTYYSWEGYIKLDSQFIVIPNPLNLTTIHSFEGIYSVLMNMVQCFILLSSE